jgi:hypothetical protein
VTAPRHEGLGERPRPRSGGEGNTVRTRARQVGGVGRRSALGPSGVTSSMQPIILPEASRLRPRPGVCPSLDWPAIEVEGWLFERHDPRVLIGPTPRLLAAAARHIKELGGHPGLGSRRLIHTRERPPLACGVRGFIAEPTRRSRGLGQGGERSMRLVDLRAQVGSRALRGHDMDQAGRCVNRRSSLTHSGAKLPDRT